MGVPAATTSNGLRVTSTAYLKDAPSNLCIKTGCKVARVLFEDNRAVGVQACDGSICKFIKISQRQPLIATVNASKEIILSAGAINSPKVLMLSGIGPEEELAKHGITKIVALPGVGQNLKDHCLVRLKGLVRPNIIPSVSLNDVVSWKTQWDIDQSGPLAMDPSLMALGYFPHRNVTKWVEFQELDGSARDLLTKPQAASYELGIVSSLLPIILSISADN